MLYGTTFTRKYAERILPRFTEWVENIANGQLIGFFDVLGKYLREAIDDMKANPDAYADEQSVMKVCDFIIIMGGHIMIISVITSR